MKATEAGQTMVSVSLLVCSVLWAYQFSPPAHVLLGIAIQTVVVQALLLTGRVLQQPLMLQSFMVTLFFTNFIYGVHR